jgi:uncharacterized protein
MNDISAFLCMVIKHYSGFGVGLRPCHYADVIKNKPALDWFELLTEDYLVDGGVDCIEQIVSQYPVALHGVSLSIGSTDPLNQTYLTQLKALIEHVKPLWVSDHFCWTGVDGVNLHDLMPLPFNQTSITHLVSRIKVVQDFLGQQILLENVSSYIDFQASNLTEWDYISEVVEKADCLLLLDINNIYVNAFNHHFDPYKYLNNVPKDRVFQFHLSGHHLIGGHIIDSHDSDIIPSVWELYEKAVQRFPNAATLIERDDNIPPLAEMLMELNKAREIKFQYA